MSENFEIVLQTDGLFLTVFPDCNASLSDVSAQLRERGLLDYNGDAILRRLMSVWEPPFVLGNRSKKLPERLNFAFG